MLARLSYRLLAAAPARVVEPLRRHPVAAAALRRLAWLLARRLRGRPVAVRGGEAAGLLLVASPASIVWLSGGVEAPVQRAFRRLLRPGGAVLDVGANVGFFSLLAARLVGPAGTVVAFEPHPGNLAELRANIEANGAENVRVVEAAVSSWSGEAMLDTGSAALARLAGEGGAGGLRVRTTTVDAFLADAPGIVPALVKIDVEGHEVEVLRGMAETLRRHRPVVVCELHGTNETCARAFRELGYEAAALELEGRVEDAPAWAHVLATPGRPS